MANKLAKTRKSSGKQSQLSAKSFQSKVSEYQNRIYYSIRGRCIRQAAGKDLNAQQTALIHALIVTGYKNDVDLGMGFFPAAVSLLFTLMTPYNIALYSKRISQAYMATVSKQIEELTGLILVTGYRPGQCRKFAVDRDYARQYNLIQSQALLDAVADASEEELAFAMTKAGVGTGFDRTLHPLTQATLDKVKEGQFRFNACLFWSPDGKSMIKGKKLNHQQIDNLNWVLGTINQFSEAPQYHDSFHLQRSGRMHTVGGCLSLTKWIRDAFVLPVDPANVRLEVDMKCAHLLILCDILDCPEVKQRIMQVLDRGESIWDYIGDRSLDKAIKKVIVYGFCYGAKLNGLPTLANAEAKDKGLDIRLTSKDIKLCLQGILEPLVKARREWLKEYTLESILKRRGETVSNALGYAYPTYEEAVTLIGSNQAINKARNTDIGASLLAHIAQGQEQLVIQSLIANHVRHNIMTFQYDGFTIEVPAEEVEAVKAEMTIACHSPLEFRLS